MTIKAHKNIKNTKKSKPSLDKTINLAKINFHPSSVCFINSSVKLNLEKKLIFSELAKLLINTQKLPSTFNQNTLVEELLSRELEASTYLGNEVALPHITLPRLPKNLYGVLVVIKLSKPVEWRWKNKNNPIDFIGLTDSSATNSKSKKKTVDMVWGLVSSEEHHLKNLKALTQILSDSEKISALRASKNSTQFFQLLTGKKPPKKPDHPITELTRHSKILESDFLMPPHWQLHARPATAFVQYIKKLLSTFFSNPKSTAPNYSLWIKYRKKIAVSTSLVEVLSLGITPNRKISLLVMSSNKNHKNNSLNIFTADKIIKQAKAFLIGEAITELQQVDYSTTTNLNPTAGSLPLVDIESNTDYKKIIADCKKKLVKSKLIEFELHSFANSFSAYENPNPLQIKSALFFRQHHYQNDLKSQEATEHSSLTVGKNKNVATKKLKPAEFTREDFSYNLVLLEHAILKTRQNIAHEQQKLAEASPSDKSQDILSVHHELLNSQTLAEEVKSYYYSHLDNLKLNHSLPPIMQIWEQVIKRKINLFNARPSLSLQARVDDWHDLARRVSLKLWELLETPKLSQAGKSPLPSKSSPISISTGYSRSNSLSNFLTTFFKKKNQSPDYILITEELFPSQVVEIRSFIKKKLIKTIILKYFNPHSHAAIMLANYQVAVYGLKEPAQFNKTLISFFGSETKPILIDPFKPTMLISKEGFNNLPANDLFKYNQKVIELIKELKSSSPLGNFDKNKLNSIPKSLHNNFKSLEFMVNINNEHDLELLQDIIKTKSTNTKNNIGVGLFRSELYFGHRKKAPSFAEQIKIYTNLAKICYPAPVVVRTIDVAKDKLISFLKPAADEPSEPIYEYFFANTKRIKYFTKTERNFVNEQIRALTTVAQKYNNIQVLFPMVVNQEDFFIYWKLLSNHPPNLKCGVMIETPSLLYDLPLLNSFVDFYSIGTNDLSKFLNFEPREKQVFDEPNKYMSLLLAMEKISQLTHNLPKSIHTVNKKTIPLTVCGNHATNQNLLYEFIELGVYRFSVPLSAFNQLSILKEFFKSSKVTSKTIKRDHVQHSEQNKSSQLKDLRNYLFKKI